MLRAVVAGVVDTEHDRVVGVRGGRGDDHLLGAGRQVLLGSLSRREEPGRLEHDVDPEVAPGQGGGIALGEHLHLLAARVDDAVTERHITRERPQHRVVLEEVCHRGGVTEVVDRDDLHVSAERLLGTEEVPPDAPETVDANANRHVSSLSSKGDCASSLAPPKSPIPHLPAVVG